MGVHAFHTGAVNISSRGQGVHMYMTRATPFARPAVLAHASLIWQQSRLSTQPCWIFSYRCVLQYSGFSNTYRCNTVQFFMFCTFRGGYIVCFIIANACIHRVFCPASDLQLLLSLGFSSSCWQCLFMFYTPCWFTFGHSAVKLLHVRLHTCHPRDHTSRSYSVHGFVYSIAHFLAPGVDLTETCGLPLCN